MFMKLLFETPPRKKNRLPQEAVHTDAIRFPALAGFTQNWTLTMSLLTCEFIKRHFIIIFFFNELRAFG
jgi:hypothetical protein